MKILVADDHALIRDGLTSMLKAFGADIEIVQAASGVGVESALSKNPDIDLLILDLILPDCHGLELLDNITPQYPALPVVILSAEYDAETVTRAIQSGASGFVPKTAINDVLVSALRLVLSGGVYLPPEALGGNLTLHRGTSKPVSAQTLGLTERQTQVLHLLLEGKSNKHICRQLGLAEATVKVHVRAILRALNARSRTEAVVAANRLGIRAQTPTLQAVNS